MRLPGHAQTLYYGFRPFAYFDAGRRRHGDMWTARVLGQRWTVLTDPAAIREVFTGDPELLYSGEANLPLRPLIGTRNVLLLDGGEHLRRRKLLLPPLHGERMQAYRELMAQATRRELERWPVGRPGAALPHMQAITFDVIMRAVFGLEDGARMDRMATLLRAALNWIQGRRLMFRYAFRGAEGLVGWPPFERVVAPIDRELLAEIRRRREAADLERREDILSLLLLARDDDGEPLPDRDVRDELLTLLTAGHETTAALLAWAVHFVARDPETQERLAAREPGWAEAVVTETLRLRPPVPLVLRRLKGPMAIAGHELPAGETVAPCGLLVHRDPALYPDPEAFQPQRFVGVKPGTYTWIPFGGGVRRCLGAAFAQLEARVVLEELLGACSLHAPRRREPVFRRGIVLVPLRGGRVTLEPGAVQARAPLARAA